MYFRLSDWKLIREKVAVADGWLAGMYINLALLLRSLRACSLGVVLVKVAKIHRYDADRSPVSVFWDDERAGAIFVLQQPLI